MRHFFTILGHEIRMLLVSPSTYIAAVLFLAIMGLIFTGLLEVYSEAPQETAPAYDFFRLFWLPVFIMVPLMTMKSVSEERRLGTLETLLTTPVSTAEVVLGKYGAAYFLYLLLWGSTGGLFYILHRFAGNARLLDPGTLIGGYLFVAVSGLLFVAIGVFGSALARNQAVAAVFALAMLFALIFGVRLTLDVQLLRLDILHPVRTALDYAQVFQHLDDFSRGIIDIRHLIFYFTGTALTLILTILGVEAKLLHH
ncbi:MAG TPA: ABC transporter permease [Opitutaceae bacterium]|nr:ABC transporter permease [Opitutaceae bacterium]